VFTPAERERLRADLLSAARSDPRITGGAITGSASVSLEDAWSDIDLAFGVADGATVADVLADWSERMYREHGVVDHLDVPSGAWIYRVFLLPSTLQVDLAFAPAKDFGARAPTFRLVFGKAADLAPVPPPVAEQLVGWAWLYALHARSSLARGRLWQAEYIVGAMRDQVLALACLRHGLPARDGRGMDRLPAEVTRPLAKALVARIDATDISRAFRVATDGLLAEAHHVDLAVARALEPALLELARS